MLANRVREITTTTGTGDITLGGALAGCIRFVDAFAEGDTVTYVIEDGDNYEIGTGTLASGNRLERTQVQESLADGVYHAGGGAPISLSGDARVYCAVTSQFLLSPDKTADSLLPAGGAGVSVDGVLHETGHMSAPGGGSFGAPLDISVPEGRALRLANPTIPAVDFYAGEDRQGEVRAEAGAFVVQSRSGNDVILFADDGGVIALKNGPVEVEGILTAGGASIEKADFPTLLLQDGNQATNGRIVASAGNILYQADQAGAVTGSYHRFDADGEEIAKFAAGLATLSTDLTIRAGAPTLTLQSTEGEGDASLTFKNGANVDLWTLLSSASSSTLEVHNSSGAAAFVLDGTSLAADFMGGGSFAGPLALSDMASGRKEGTLRIGGGDHSTDGGCIILHGSTAGGAEGLLLAVGSEPKLAWLTAQEKWDFQGQPVDHVGQLDVGGTATFGSGISLNNSDISKAARMLSGSPSGALILSGSATLDVGVDLYLFGESHASAPLDFSFSVAGTSVIRWNNARAVFEFKGNPLVQVPGLFREDTDSVLALSGGADATSGAAIMLYGPSHPSRPNDLVIKCSNNAELSLDQSLSIWDFHGNIASGLNRVQRGVGNNTLILSGGSDDVSGGNIVLYGEDGGGDMGLRAGPHTLLSLSGATRSATFGGHVTLGSGTDGQLRIRNTEATTAGDWWLQVRDTGDFQIRDNAGSRNIVEVSRTTGQVSLAYGLQITGNTRLERDAAAPLHIRRTGAAGDQLVFQNDAGTAGVIGTTSDRLYLGWGDQGQHVSIDDTGVVHVAHQLIAEALSLSGSGDVRDLHMERSDVVTGSLGRWECHGRNAAGQDIRYGRILMSVEDNTAGSESGSMLLSVVDEGVLKNRVTLDASGVQLSGDVRVSGIVAGLSDDTSNRPAASDAGVGASMFDTTLGRPIWSDGSQWIDASGTAV
jgi:hypothetical protein